MPIVVERSLFLGSLNPRRGGNALALRKVLAIAGKTWGSSCRWSGDVMPGSVGHRCARQLRLPLWTTWTVSLGS